jgi:GNAT superfamily N-acetyltransferase
VRSSEALIELRTATLADMPALARIFREASLTNDDDRPHLLAHPEVLEFCDAGVREQRTRVAIVDGSIVGFATTAPHELGTELEDLFVAPEWMRKGIASALVQDAAAIAQAAGHTRIELTANRHALAFYERAGFVVDGDAHTRFGSAVQMHLDVGTADPSDQHD